MKKFIISVLCAAVFFIGLGGLLQETGARFKSDDRALDLIKKAQTALGGESALQNVKSISIKGNVAKTLELNGATKVEQGEVEINLQLPNKFVKSMKLGNTADSDEAANGELKKEFNVFVMRENNQEEIFNPSEANDGKQHVFIMKKGDGEKVVMKKEPVGAEGKKALIEKDVIHARNGGIHQNELFRTTLALLLTAPQGTDAAYSYVGDGDVDGNACDVVEVKTGNSAVRLFLDKSSHLPRMMSYQGFKPLIVKFSRDEAKTGTTPETKILTNRLEKPEPVEIQVKFSDYRTVNGVLFPHRWMQTAGGKADENFEVASFEVNPANIAEKLQNAQPKTLIRTVKSPQ